VADPDRPSTYLFRSTEDKLEQHLQSIADAGDTVEHTVFKGGRDYVLVVRRAGAEPLTVRLDDDTVERLSAALVETASKIITLTVKRVGSTHDEGA
jgi:hypothetical protein